MGTEKFIAFKEDGTAYRLKGRILRFLDNEPVSEADKTNIRSTLSVPASAEGLTPANNLSDLDNAATARTNLSVNSVDEDAEATGTKLVGPAMYFNGTSSYVEVADDAKLSFTDGTDDLPFTLSAWVKFDNVTANQDILSKYGTFKEWRLFHSLSNGLTLRINDGTNLSEIYTGTLLSPNQWYHVAVTYGGSGPNSANAFTAAMDSGNAELFINNVIVASPTRSSNASYVGMSDTAEPVRIGKTASTYTKGHIKDVKLYNRSLTADEVAQLVRGTDLGYADEYAGALGGVYASDHSAGTQLSSSVRLTATAPETIGSVSNTLKLTQDDAQSSTKVASKALTMTVGKRYRIAFDYYSPSGNAQVQKLRAYIGSSVNGINGTRIFDETLVDDAWTRFTYEGVLSASGGYLTFSLHDGSSENYLATNGTDYIGLKNIKITEIGKLADFRAENYNQSASKLVDRSTNNFVGVGTGVTLTGKRRHLSAATLDLTNLPTSSAGLSAGEVWSNSGVLTIV